MVLGAGIVGMAIMAAMPYCNNRDNSLEPLIERLEINLDHPYAKCWIPGKELWNR